jgi:hypothetical protein
MIDQLSAALTALKTAMDVGKALKDADYAVEKATLKYQAAEFMSALAEAKLAISAANEVIERKDNEIASLCEALDAKDTVKLYHNAYYSLDEQGKPTGDPYCQRCWEVDHCLLHMIVQRQETYCPECKTKCTAGRMAR